MWKFISAAISIWQFIAPIYNDVMLAIKRVTETNLEDVAARNAVKQEITDLVQKHALKNTKDSKINAGIEICYQIYLISKKG